MQNAHLLDQHPVLAVLDRNDKYRDNGRTEISSDGAKLKRVYNNDVKIEDSLKALGIGVKSGAIYKQGSAGHCAQYHFDKFQNSLLPYYNVGHHILPCEVFRPREEGKKSGGAFTWEQHEILKRTTYDVNNGKNVIFLPGFSTGLITRWGINRQTEQNPGFDWNSIKGTAEGKGLLEQWSEHARKKLDRYGSVHQLPCHIDFHSDYTLKVCDDMDKVAQELKREADNLCEKWTPPTSIPQTIINIQSDYWNYIVIWGEKNPLKSVNFLEKLSDAATDIGSKKRRRVV